MTAEGCDAVTFVCGWLDCPTHGVPDDGGPVADPCTPYVGEHWQVVVVRLSEHHFKTVFSSGNRHFVLADSDDPDEALVHCTHIRNCFVAALADVRAREPLTRGALVNRRIAIGSEIVALRARLVELEKIAKRTPPKTLASERERVAKAKTELARARELLPRLEEERDSVVAAEASFSPACEIRTGGEPAPDYRALLRRAICDFVEPLVLSHLTAGTEWREAANKFVLECAPLVFGAGESVFGVKRLPDGEPALDRRTIAYLSRDFRCAECGELLTNHVVISRHERGPCDETYTGPSLRVYLGESDADEGRSDLSGPESGAAQGDEAAQGPQGPAGGEGRSGARVDEAGVPRLRPIDDAARHCGDDGNGCSAPDACFCSCADCIVARDVAREDAL